MYVFLYVVRVGWLTRNVTVIGGWCEDREWMVLQESKVGVQKVMSGEVV